jgi:hypothetical protein
MESQWEQLVGLEVPPALYRSCSCHLQFALLAACFMLLSSVAYSLILKMEAICSSDNSHSRELNKLQFQCLAVKILGDQKRMTMF